MTVITTCPKVTTVSGVDEVTHWLAVRLPPSIATVPEGGIVTGEYDDFDDEGDDQDDEYLILVGCEAATIHSNCT